MSFHTGFIMAHRPALEYLQKRHVRMAEFQYLKSSNGSKSWQDLYNYPLYGLGYRYVDFGNDKELGKGHALYSQMLLPLSRKNRFNINVRFGVGIGFIEKPFNSENNYKNLAIGSHLNGTVLTGLQFRFLTKKKIQLFGGVDFFHFSNGAFSLPNLGINLPSINFGLAYFSGNPLYHQENKEEKPKLKRELTTAIGIGFKERYPPDGPKYSVKILNMQYQFPLHQKGRVGIGTEAMFDASLQPRLENDSIYLGKLEASTRIGVFGSIGLRMGRWDALLQPGLYLYNKVKEDGSIYNRLLLKYNLSHHFYAGVGLKSHFAKADYFEWSIGYKI